MKKLSDVAELNQFALKDGKPYKCEREGCNNYVPARRRKYCSDECGRITSIKNLKQRQTNNKNNLIYQLIRKNMKERTCLQCRRNFLSKGSWNRICPNCKERNSLLSQKYY